MPDDIPHRRYEERDPVEGVRRVARPAPARDAEPPARGTPAAERAARHEVLLPDPEPLPSEPRAAAAASARIAGILAAAERSADEIRETAEQRADARIAEADRAAELRVRAADDEAADVIAEAEATARARIAAAHEEVRQIHEAAAAAREHAELQAGQTVAAADEQARRTVAQAQTEAESLLTEAGEQADDLRRTARAEAREIIGEAHTVAREAMHEGERLTGDLRDLSSSLRTNAERLMRDVSAAHGRLVAGLDQAAPADTTPRRRPREAGPVDDVPEFLPGLD